MDADPAPRARTWAPVCAAAAVLLAAAATTGTVLIGGSWSDFVDTYTLTNTALGLALAGCGALIGWFHPRNAVGVLYMIGGLGHLVSAACAPLGMFGLDQGWPAWTTRFMAGLFLSAWGLGLPTLALLALVLFPDGRPPSPRWRPVVGYFLLLAAVSFVLGVINPYDLVAGELASRPLLAIEGIPMAELENLYGWVALPSPLLALAALVVRYVHGDERVRRQLMWLILALVGSCIINSQRWITGNGPVLLLLSTVLIPVAIAIAIVRYRLLDIRLVLSRTLLYVLLIVLIIAMYAGLVALMTMVVPPEADRAVVIIAAVAVALALDPLRTLLQRAVTRGFFGSRDDPASTVAGMYAEQGLEGLLSHLRTTLRMPRVLIVTGAETIAADGVEPADALHATLRIGAGSHCDDHSDDTGAAPPPDANAALIVTLRTGEKHLHDADRAALELVIPGIALLLRERRLLGDLRLARTLTAQAREHERKSLHRDLHDGLGPVLTGAAMRLDAAANLLDTDPRRASDALRQARADIGSAIDGVRRVVYGLRPVALDEAGLIGALREEARGEQTPTVRVHATEPFPQLSPAVELAAYHVVMEAVTNARRHSTATRVDVRLWAASVALHIRVDDDGAPQSRVRPGAGLRSLHERVEELGGEASAAPVGTGWSVSARIPLS